jgi:O-antigen ligase
MAAPFRNNCAFASSRLRYVARPASPSVSEAPATGALRRANAVLFALTPAALLASNVAAELLILCIDLSFAWHLVSHRANPLRRPDFALLVLVWLVLNLAVSPAAEVSASFGRSLPWLRFVLLYGAATQWLLVRDEDVRLVALTWCGLLGLIIADMAVQLATGVSLTGNAIYSERLTGPLDRPGIGAVLAKLGFPALGCVLTAALRERRHALLGSVLLLAFMGVAALVLSADRNETVLALGGLLFVLASTATIGRRAASAAAAAALGVGLLVAGIIVASARMTARTQLLMDQLSSFPDSPYGQLFKAAWAMFGNDPVTGVGLRGFRGACETYLGDGAVSLCGLHPHNIYLEWLAEGGLLTAAGLMAFTALLLLQGYRAWREPGVTRFAAAMIGAGLLVTFFPVAASRSFFSNWPAILTWVSIGLSVAMLNALPALARARP